MNYDFDKVINRKHTNSIKWDFAAERGMPEGLLPMWVADMDFAAPQEVLDDIQQAVNHGIFGYTEVKQDYYDILSDWFDKRYGFDLAADVVKTGLCTLLRHVRALTEPDEAVLIQTPVYYPFYDVIRSNGRRLVTNPLKVCQ